MTILQRDDSGFVLIEMMVVAALIGIVLALVVPGYQLSILESYRKEACGELMHIANLQQQLLTDQQRFTADLTEFGYSEPQWVTASGRYRIFAELTKQGYILRAQANGPQQQDKDCQVILLDQYGVKSSMPTSHCWQY